MYGGGKGYLASQERHSVGGRESERARFRAEDQSASFRRPVTWRRASDRRHVPSASIMLNLGHGEPGAKGRDFDRWAEGHDFGAGEAAAGGLGSF